MPQFLQSIIDHLGGLASLAFVVIAIVAAYLLYRFGKQMQAAMEVAGTALKWVKFVLTWAFPPLLTLLAWIMPSMHKPIEAAFAADSSATRGALLIIGGLGVIWLLAVQLLTASNPSTTLRELISDFWFSAVWMVIGLLWAGAAYGTGTLELWLAVPAAYAVADVFFGTVAGFRNAFQKNPTQMTKGGTE